jgi:hypothetical protein
MRFDQATLKKREFANFQLGQYQRSQTGLSLLEDMSALRWMLLRFSNMAELLKQG